MNLPLEPKLSIGVQTIHRRTEPATGPWLPSARAFRSDATECDARAAAAKFALTAGNGRIGPRPPRGEAGRPAKARRRR